MKIQKEIASTIFDKSYKVEVLLPPSYNKHPEKRFPVVFSNDGQDFEKLNLAQKLKSLYAEKLIPELVLVGVHAGERRQEYGVAAQADYLERGADAGKYSNFFINEFLPWIESEYRVSREPALRAIMGFSLGGLSAMDIGWSNFHLFKFIGVFSGSFWWRSKSLENGYQPSDRIMHSQLASSTKKSLKIWLQSGGKDELSDRDKDGLIDSIGDTLDLILVLQNLGYCLGKDLRYLDLPNARHDMQAWSDALPDFLRFCFSIRD